MQTMSENWQSNITAPARYVTCKVELYNGSTLLNTFLPGGKLQSVIIDVSAPQMFGFAASQTLKVGIIDKDGTVTAAKGNVCKVYIGTANGSADEYAGRCFFYVDAFERKGCIVTITAYDALAALAGTDVIENVDVTAPFTVREYASAIASHIGLSAAFDTGACNNLTYTADALPNLTGRETLRDVLTRIAEVTGTVCYMDCDNHIRFRVPSAASALSVSKSDYFSFSIENSTTLTGVTSTTELGDNLTAGDSTGFNQILRDNPFIVNRNDIPAILTAILTQNSPVSIVPYKLKWRGNPALEYGDTVTITRQDDTTAAVVYLGETLKYTGGLSADSDFDMPREESPQSNPTSIGERVNQTIARVDKINQRITIEASRTDGLESDIANIVVSTDDITQSVKKVQEDNGVITERISAIEETSDRISASVKSIVDNGVSKVVTETGATLDLDGLHVTKSGEEMESRIDYSGLYVERADIAILTANANGVEAENVTVRTYLTIGKNSRLEDYGSNRTGCFYVGGSS